MALDRTYSGQGGSDPGYGSVPDNNPYDPGYVPYDPYAYTGAVDAAGNPIGPDGLGSVPGPDPWTPGENPPPAPPAGGGTDPGGGGSTPGYALDKLRAGLLAYGVPATAENLAAFIKAHPEFATGVTIGGSKNNKLYYNGQYLAKAIGNTDGDNPYWTWDTSTDGGDSGGAGLGDPSAIDPSYLAPFDEVYQDPAPTTGGPYVAPTFSYGTPRPNAIPWTNTTAADVLADPSYQFRFGQGQQAIEGAASARGLLGSGGTLKDLIDYGQNFAMTDFGNVDARRFNVWDQTNANTAADWQSGYDTALGTFKTNADFGLEGWKANDTHDINAANTARAGYGTRRDTWYSNQDKPWNKISDLIGYGAQAAGA